MASRVTDWTTQTKRCAACKEVKPFSEFFFTKDRRVKRHPNGYPMSECKPCLRKRVRDHYHTTPRTPGQNREAWLLHKFGLSLTQYAEMLAQQGGGCAICGEPPSDVSHHVDHDHQTGRIRGILCHRCNLGLGNFDDDLIRLERALAYLRGEPLSVFPADATGHSTATATIGTSRGLT